MRRAFLSCMRLRPHSLALRGRGHVGCFASSAGLGVVAAARRESTDWRCCAECDGKYRKYICKYVGVANPVQLGQPANQAMWPRQPKQAAEARPAHVAEPIPPTINFPNGRSIGDKIGCNLEFYFVGQTCRSFLAVAVVSESRS